MLGLCQFKMYSIEAGVKQCMHTRSETPITSHSDIIVKCSKQIIMYLSLSICNHLDNERGFNLMRIFIE